MTRFFHVNNQFLWRNRRQALAFALIGILVASLVATAYLATAAQADILGRETLNLREQIAEAERINADLETELAGLLSVDSLRARAIGLGFRPAGPDEVQYVRVAGYVPPATQLAALGGTARPQTEEVLPSEYTMSLLDWFDLQMRNNLGASR